MGSLNLKLYAISFLESIYLGLINPILAPHILTLGGNHFVLGLLASSTSLLQLFAGPLIRSWTDTLGRKLTLLVTLIIALICYYHLAVFDGYLYILLTRFLYALTDQRQTLCKAYVADLNPKEAHDGIYNIMSILDVIGFVVGPIVGCTMYDWNGGFYLVTYMTCALHLISIGLTLTLPPNVGKPLEPGKSTTLKEKIKEDFQQITSSLHKINWPSHWQPILIKTLFTCSTSVYFIKFSMLIRGNYSFPQKFVGYTFAYQSILTFVSAFLTTYLTSSRPNDPMSLTGILMGLVIGMMGLCYAPKFDFFLASVVPMILMRSLFSYTIKNVFSKVKIKESEMTLDKVASIVVPFVFGIFCDMYGIKAIEMFTIVPLLIAVLLTIVASNHKPTHKPSQKVKIDKKQ